MAKPRLFQQVLSRRYRPRLCDRCGDPYGRRNLFEAWIQQAPGKLTGWRKVRMRICLRCQNQPRTVRSLIMVEATISKNHQRQLTA